MSDEVKINEKRQNNLLNGMFGNALKEDLSIS